MTTPNPNPGSGGTPNPDPGAGGAPNPNPGAGGAPASAWHENPAFDQDTRAWLGTKGFDKLGADAALPEITKSFRNVEKLLGVPSEQIIRMPKDDTPEAWAPIYDKLGRPTDAKGYDIPVPEGQDTAYADWARGTFHELGLSSKQAKGLTEKWNAFVAEKTQAAQTEYQNGVAADTASLKKEWGAAHEKNLQIAKGAAREFGLDGKVIDALERSMGFAGVMKFMHAIGAKLGEDKFVGSGKPGGFGDVMTPEAAQAQIRALRGDPGFTARYVAGDVAAKAEMERLHKYAYPEG